MCGVAARMADCGGVHQVLAATIVWLDLFSCFVFLISIPFIIEQFKARADQVDEHNVTASDYTGTLPRSRPAAATPETKQCTQGAPPLVLRALDAAWPGCILYPHSGAGQCGCGACRLVARNSR